MRNTDQSSSLFWLVIGIGIALCSLKYGFGTLHEPGPGFITFFAGAILIILSLALFLSSLRDQKGRSGWQSLWAGLEFGKVLYVILLLVTYTLVLKSIGFLISTFFLLSLLFRVKGTYRLRTILFISFLVTVSSYVIFEIWLKAQLPKGILERIM
jgi:putative tricarboxylic transport membrane protein